MMKTRYWILIAMLVLIATVSVFSAQVPSSKMTTTPTQESSTIQSPVDSYSVVIYGEDQTSSDLVAYIHCYYKGQNVASCEFYRDGTTLPTNRYQGGRIGLTYSWSQFEAVLDVLRNETPVFVAFIESTKVGYVATGTSTSSHGNEPVGEGE